MPVPCLNPYARYTRRKVGAEGAAGTVTGFLRKRSDLAKIWPFPKDRIWTFRGVSRDSEPVVDRNHRGKFPEIPFGFRSQWLTWCVAARNRVFASWWETVVQTWWCCRWQPAHRAPRRRGFVSRRPGGRPPLTAPVLGSDRFKVAPWPIPPKR